ncbi:GCN5-related N-acetyltransferase [uncultured Desulfatiglans sp.]|uniref:GCN5-related N-acetyltransferase n=1 Tax=Uncultured Desulfatiglans sp. TaxID=1748965 RepID=A0A653A9U3_UNCDX|nr:GCN5-related N-acetyltransferase [uncultured Desulfatiglans sp.]
MFHEGVPEGSLPFGKKFFRSITGSRRGNMSREKIAIRRMEGDEVELALEWAAQEGWNPGLYDAECFYAADPRGFFMAEIDGEPAGCISAVAYDENFAFAGFFIVREDVRHLGIGMMLTRKAMEYLGDRTVGGDGVVGMLPKYEQIGFRIAHQNARYEGVGASSGRPLSDLRELPFSELERYDRRFFPASRTAFLERWITRPGTRGCAATVDGRVAGYGVIRPCRVGFKIGPLFADAPQVAEDLFRSLTGFAAGEKFFLDIPVCNPFARELAERHAMQKVFETARIYKGDAPRLPLEGIYGITSFELG